MKQRDMQTKLRTLMYRKKIYQQDLASWLGVTQGNISAFCRKGVKDADIAEKIANAINAKMNSNIKWTDICEPRRTKGK